MQVLDYAIKMEEDGENYYRELAGKAKSRGLISILNMLADAEVKHRKALEQLKKNRPAELQEGSIRNDVKNVFTRMQDDGEKFDSGISEIDLYKKAQGIEAKSRDFYTERAENADSPDSKELFLRLAGEEKLHFMILDSIIEFVSQPLPGNWLENAEWYHTEDY